MPDKLPNFQCTGCVWRPESMVYANVQECFRAFEDVVCAHDQDMDRVWHQYMPILNSPEQRSWFADNLEYYRHRPWSFARAIYERDFAVDDFVQDALNVNAFMACKMGKKETVCEYTARFHQLRHNTGQDDDQISANRYLNGLRPAIADRVYIAHASLPAHLKRTVRQVSGLALALEESYDQRCLRVGDAASPGSNARSSSSQDKICKLHGRGNHVTEECRVWCSTKKFNSLKVAPKHKRRGQGSTTVIMKEE